MLISTYHEYKSVSQDIMVFIGLTSSILTVYEFIIRKK